MTRLIDVWRSGQLTLSEYQSYLDLGYQPSDQIQLTSGRSAEMITTSYMDLGSGRSWTVKSGETLLGYIGPNSDMVNAGDMTIDGDVTFLYNSGKLTSTGIISGSGNLTIYPLKLDDL